LTQNKGNPVQGQTPQIPDRKAETKFLREQFSIVEIAVLVSNENGLFLNNQATYDVIQHDLNIGREYLSSKEPKLLEAHRAFNLAWFYLNNQVNKKGFWWRFKYCFGGPALAYLIASFIVILSAIIFSPALSSGTVLTVPTWAFLWGALGGILHGFWSLWQHVSDRCFRKPWYIWYLLLPAIGAVLGALTYLIFAAGLIATTGGTVVKSESLLMLLSALAGFSSAWAIKILDQITNQININPPTQEQGKTA
jgi:hypothetical protein